MSCNLQSSLTCSSKTSGASTQLLRPCARTNAFRPFQSKQRNNSAELASNRACLAADTSLADPSFGNLNRRQLLQIAGTSVLILQYASESKVRMLHISLIKCTACESQACCGQACAQGLHGISDCCHLLLLGKPAARGGGQCVVVSWGRPF